MNKIVYLRGEKLSSFAVFAYDKNPNLLPHEAECLCYVHNDILPRGTIKRLKAGEIIKAELKCNVWKCVLLEEGE